MLLAPGSGGTLTETGLEGLFKPPHGSHDVIKWLLSHLVSCFPAGVTAGCTNDDLHSNASRVLPTGARRTCLSGGFTAALQQCEAACQDNLVKVDSLVVWWLADNSWGTAQGNLNCSGMYVQL